MQARYFRPKSLTWWAGVSLVALGAAKMAGAGDWANEVSAIVSALSGEADTSPAGLIGTGLGLVGIRDVLARAYGGV